MSMLCLLCCTLAVCHILDFKLHLRLCFGCFSPLVFERFSVDSCKLDLLLKLGHLLIDSRKLFITSCSAHPVFICILNSSLSFLFDVGQCLAQHFLFTMKQIVL